MEQLSNLFDELHLGKEKSILKVFEPNGFTSRFLILYLDVFRENFPFLQCV